MVYLFFKKKKIKVFCLLDQRVLLNVEAEEANVGIVTKVLRSSGFVGTFFANSFLSKEVFC